MDIKAIERKRYQKHGATCTRLYGIWEDIKKRCFKPSHVYYMDYGGRGISMCKEWLTFNTFREWAVANGYSPELSIDRKEVNGDYCPDNCRWATMREQCRNRRNRSNSASKYKGVSVHHSKWRAMIHLGKGNSICLGRFDDEREAAEAYDAAALLHFGEFACINFPARSARFEFGEAG